MLICCFSFHDTQLGMILYFEYYTKSRFPFWIFLHFRLHSLDVSFWGVFFQITFLIKLAFDKESVNIKFLLSFNQYTYMWEEAAQSFLTLCTLDFDVAMIKPVPSLFACSLCYAAVVWWNLITKAPCIQAVSSAEWSPDTKSTSGPWGKLWSYRLLSFAVVLHAFTLNVL